MKIIPMVITVFILLIVIGTVIFGLLVYPIWALIHCATSETRSRKSKVAWIIVIILTWLSGAIVYGIFASKRKLFQWISALLLVAGVITIVLFSAAMNYATKVMNAELTDMLSRVDTVDTAELSPEQILKLKGSLLVVKQELNAGIMEYDKKRRSILLSELFGIIEKDSKISLQEYKDWMDKYVSRSLMDSEALDRYIKKLKTQ